MAEIDLDKLSQNELIELKRSLLEYWLSNRAKLQNARPKEKDCRRAANFEENLAQWELNFQKNEKLFTEQKTKLDNRIKKRSKDLTESEILANMYENELQILPLLEKEGRIILPDTIREVHEQVVASGFPLFGTPNSSVDRFVLHNDTGKLILINEDSMILKGTLNKILITFTRTGTRFIFSPYSHLGRRRQTRFYLL